MSPSACLPSRRLGGVLAFVGLVFSAAHRLAPDPYQAQIAAEDTAHFEIKDYVTEILVPEDHPLINEQIFRLESLSDGGIQVVGIIRGATKLFGNLRLRHIRKGDILMVQAGSERAAGLSRRAKAGAGWR